MSSSSAQWPPAHSCVRVFCWRWVGKIRDRGHAVAAKGGFQWQCESNLALLDDKGRLSTKSISVLFGIREDRLALVSLPSDSVMSKHTGRSYGTIFSDPSPKSPFTVKFAGEYIPVAAIPETAIPDSRKYMMEVRSMLNVAGAGPSLTIYPPQPILLETHIGELSPQMSSLSRGPARHDQVWCDNEGCKRPVEGIRYKCNPVTGCPNFDFCEECFNQPSIRSMHDPTHEFIALPRPIRLATTLFADTSIGIILNACANYDKLPFIGEMKPQDKLSVEATSSVTPPLSSCLSNHPMNRLRQYNWISFSSLQIQFLSLGTSLRRLLPIRSFVGLYAPNSTEWILADFACCAYALISVAVHPLYSREIVSNIIRSTKMKAILVKGESQLETIISIAEESLPTSPTTLKFVIAIDWASLSAITIARAKSARLYVLDYASFVALSSNFTSCDAIEFTPDEELSTVVYTSGSTGLPKGSMFTERLMRLDLQDGLYRSDVSLEVELFPLAWMMGRLAFRHSIGNGGAICLYTGPPSNILDEYRLIEPTRIGVVPVIWNQFWQLYKKFVREMDTKKEIEEKGKLTDFIGHAVEKITSDTDSHCQISQEAETKEEESLSGKIEFVPTLKEADISFVTPLKKVIRPISSGQPSAVDTKNADEPLSPIKKGKIYDYEIVLVRARTPPPDPRVINPKYPYLHEFRSTFPLGRRLETASSGGAMASTDLLSFLRAFFVDKHFYDGFGTTECGGLTVDGVLRSKNQIKLIDLPELGYYSTDKPFPRGELAVKNSVTISGYFNDPEATKSKLTEDGYWRTGDVVEYYGIMKYRIIDRVASFFKLVTGEFVSPERLEDVYGRSKYVKQVYVYGDASRPGVVAVIVPNRDEIITEMKKMATATTFEPIHRSEFEVWLGDASCLDDSSHLNHPAILALVHKDLISQCRAASLSSSQLPIAIRMNRDEFTPENGLLTVTSKVARIQLAAHFKDAINQMYKEIDDKAEAHLLSPSSSLSSSSSSSSPSSPHPVTSEIEPTNSSALLSILSRILSVSQSSIDPNMDISKLGLSSLAAVQIVETVKRETGALLDVRSLLVGSTSTDGNGHSNNTLEHLSEMIDLQVRIGSDTPAMKHILKVEATTQEFEQLRQLHADLQVSLDPPILDVTVIPTSLFSLYTSHCVASVLIPLDASVSLLSEPVLMAKQHILLTGVTGFLGGQLLYELLTKDHDSIIHCVIRPESNDTEDTVLDEKRVHARLFNKLRSRSLWKYEFASRIMVYSADIASPLLGLSPHIYSTLVHRIEIVYHSAATVNWILPYSALRQVNVIGTQHILQLIAAANSLRLSRNQSNVKLCHVSTIGIARRDERVTFETSDDFNWLNSQSQAEEILLPIMRMHTSGYNLSKWACEYLVHRFSVSCRQNMIGTDLLNLHSHIIVRPGFIGPHQMSGDSGPTDFLTRYVTTVTLTKLFVATTRVFEMTPVDEMANRILQLTVGNSSTSFSSTVTTNSDSKSSSSLTPLTCVCSITTPLHESLSYYEIGVSIARGLPPDRQPIMCQPGEFIAAVQQLPNCPLYPLLEVISEAGYFRDPQRSANTPMPSTKALGTHPHSQALEHCAKRLG